MFAYRDIWNNRVLSPEIRDGKALITRMLEPQGLGCVVQEAAPQPRCAAPLRRKGSREQSEGTFPGGAAATLRFGMQITAP